MTYLCSNKHCSYGHLDDETERRIPAPAYDQDPERWTNNIPRYHGYCYDCAVDDEEDRERFQATYEFDDHEEALADLYEMLFPPVISQDSTKDSPR